MAEYTIATELRSLNGKCIVLTGGASGIGTAVVQLATSAGAQVVFGDINQAGGQKVAQETGATFVHTDISKYSDQIGLFEAALQKHGRVDYAIANAALYEPKVTFDPGLSLEDIKQEPHVPTFEFNVASVTKFAYIAAAYLQIGNESRNTDKGIIFLGSVAALVPPPDSPFYNASKGAILGFSRSLAGCLPQTHGIRVNTICPSATKTPLLNPKVWEIFEAHGLPLTAPEEIARGILSLCADQKSVGKICVVETTRAWDVEEPLKRLLPEWLGPPSKTLDDFISIMVGAPNGAS